MGKRQILIRFANDTDCGYSDLVLPTILHDLTCRLKIITTLQKYLLFHQVEVPRLASLLHSSTAVARNVRRQ